MLDYETDTPKSAEEIARLFTETFTASEGADEGKLIGELARDLFATTPPADLHAFSARDGAVLAGSILFSRLRYPGEPGPVYLLAPVAVAPAHQGKGVGQALIRHGLGEIRARGGAAALTYGDPAFYGRVGFAPITVDAVPAPFPLSQPEGWLGLSLTDRPIGRLAGPVACVAAFDNPAHW